MLPAITAFQTHSGSLCEFIDDLCGFTAAQLSKETVLNFYQKMTLLNTMDRILYESQRQVSFCPWIPLLFSKSSRMLFYLFVL